MTSTKNFTILIVDDNQNNLFTLRTLINEHIEAEILEANSGQLALTTLMAQTVDLIILDVQMPEMDGFETAQMIRSVKKTAHIPIVFLTAAYKSVEFQAKGFAVGAADYLTKPIDPPQLISRIKIYLRFIEQEHRYTKVLEQKVAERTAELLQAHNELEQRVLERTTELAQANQSLSEANAALQQLSRHNRMILETAGDGICGIDLEGRTTFINPSAARMLGYKPEELIDQGQHDIIHYAKPNGAPYPEQECYVTLAIAQGIRQHVDDEVFWRKDGSNFPVEYVVEPIREENVITGAVLTFRDISERKKIEAAMQAAKEAAEQANFAKSCFLANMSHELRTPLNAIIGYSEILMEETKDDAEANGLAFESVDTIQDIEKIIHAAEHLLMLINDVLDLSKIEAGKMDVFNENFAINTLVKEIISVIYPLAEKRSNKLEVNYPERGLSLFTDQTKVRQILINLLSNACKFTENGRITLNISIKEEWGKQWLVFAINDTGIGLTLEQRHKLFEAFTQADISTTRKYGGTGLGLTICKHFAEMMEGTIKVDSEPGKGSTFSFYLPIISVVHEFSVSNQGELEKSLPALPPNSATIATILVIDDESNIRSLLKRFLDKLGYHTLLAADAEEGLRLAQQHQPDVITLNVMMPKQDGWRLLSELKKHPALMQVPVIMLSLVEDNNLKQSMGATDYLIKPVSREQLAGVLNKYAPNVPPSARILVVEDDTVTREMMQYVLSNAGWQVDIAENGLIALAHMEKQIPSLILADLMMPEMDGFEFIERLRQNPAWADIPIIVLTAKDIMQEDRERLEVDKIFQKSAYSQDELLATMRKVLASLIKN